VEIDHYSLETPESLLYYIDDGYVMLKNKPIRYMLVASLSSSSLSSEDQGDEIVVLSEEEQIDRGLI
jgi:hypothetical protein